MQCGFVLFPEFIVVFPRHVCVFRDGLAMDGTNLFALAQRTRATAQIGLERNHRLQAIVVDDSRTVLDAFILGRGPIEEILVESSRLVT